MHDEHGESFFFNRKYFIFYAKTVDVYCLIQHVLYMNTFPKIIDGTQN